MPSSVSSQSSSHSHGSDSSSVDDRPEVSLSNWWVNPRLNDARGMMYGLIRGNNDRVLDLFHDRNKKKPSNPLFDKDVMRIVLAESLQPPRPPPHIVAARQNIIDTGRDPSTDKVSSNYDDAARNVKLSCEDWFAAMVTSWIFDSNLSITCGVPFTVEHNEIVSARLLDFSPVVLRETYKKAPYSGDQKNVKPYNPHFRHPYPGNAASSWKDPIYPYGKWEEIVTHQPTKDARDVFVRTYVELIEISLSALSVEQEQCVRSNMEKVFDLIEPVFFKRHQKSYRVDLNYDTVVYCSIQKEWFSEVQDYFVYGVAPSRHFGIDHRAMAIMTARIILEGRQREGQENKTDVTITEISEWMHRNDTNKYYSKLTGNDLEGARKYRSWWYDRLLLESDVRVKTKSIRMK